MIDISEIDFPRLDRPEVLTSLFHPRPEGKGTRPESDTIKDILIPVEEGVSIGARFHVTGKATPNLLFFHGNGEIVADYDDLGPLYNGLPMNFLPVDYRGYGRSSGEPTATGMIQDAHVIFNFVKKWLHSHGFSGPMIVMGRSLGSAPALEIAHHYSDRIGGLIIESGFAHVVPLLNLLGINAEQLGIREEDGFRNLDKISGFVKPTLIIHAERDHIIPFSEGKALYEACQSGNKKLLEIRGANHNDIFYRGLSEYLDGIKTFANEMEMNA